jgi:DNA-binding transcriptional LysR family regulator
MDWDRLRVFHAVVEAKSLTAAGTSLDLSQSAVSRQISSLEASLKAKLFNRHARGLVLTNEGEILYQTVRHVFKLLNTAQTKISDSHETVKGTLKIATTTAIGTVWLPPRLNKFSKKFPDLNLQFLLTDGGVDFAVREADISLRFGNQKEPHPDLMVHHLFDINLRVYGSLKYFEEFGKPESPEELAKHKLIVFGGDSISPVDNVNFLLTLGAKAGEIRTPFIQMANAFGILECVRNGLGIGVLADYIAKDFEGMVPLFPSVKHPVNEMLFVYPKELEGSKRVEAFLSFLRTESKSLL